ncbi:hypothetical protein E2C01_050169 [Portunus trituberculatus]|uniref:Uncharacterized protein n=1 Tax=Portunus trituberculatus TaxID=210409 RepID=A0A5B7GF58_PORTR|nr:hypothetical protein [Portunus trituberculatus]
MIKYITLDQFFQTIIEEEPKEEGEDMSEGEWGEDSADDDQRCINKVMKNLIVDSRIFVALRFMHLTMASFMPNAA